MIKVDINLLWTVIDILLLCVLVRVFLLKPVKKILAQRQAQVDGDLAQAEKAREEAQALQEQHRLSLEGIDEEKAKAMEDATKRAAETYDRIVAGANLKAASILKAAEVDAENRKAEILRETQHEIADIIVAATAKVVGAGEGSDSALYDQFLEKVGQPND